VEIEYEPYIVYKIWIIIVYIFLHYVEDARHKRRGHLRMN